jgi:Uma2 family endonuclease
MRASSLLIGLTPEQEEEVYPETDGKPMGEGDYQIACMYYLRQALQFFFKPREEVYVAANLFWYYEEGNVKARVAADIMVVFGVPKHYRRSFRQWREAAGPQVIIEIASWKTWRTDLYKKPELYARLNVQEYYLFDAERRYFDQPLLGFRRQGRRMVQRPVAADGGLLSNRLGLRLVPEGALLRLVEAKTEKPLPTADELAELAERGAQAEAELARLRRRGKKRSNGQ